MANLFKKKSNPKKKGVIGGLGSLMEDIVIETGKGFKELGKEMIKGVTMLPKELLFNAFSENNSEHSDQDNKDKPPISKNVGEHSPVNTKKLFENEKERELEIIRKKLLSKHQAEFSRPSAKSEYGQKLVKEQQEKQKPIYDKFSEEREEKNKQKNQVQNAQASVIPSISSKRKRGDLRGGVKQKKGPSPQELNRAEFPGRKG